MALPIDAELLEELVPQVGDKLFTIDGAMLFTSRPMMQSAFLDAYAEMDRTVPQVVTIHTLKVVSSLVYRIHDGKFVPAKSASEHTYKVVRHAEHVTGSVGLLRADGDAFIRVGWPESAPFHKAFDDLTDKTPKYQVIYVHAIEVDGHYMLKEILDDQGW